MGPEFGPREGDEGEGSGSGGGGVLASDQVPRRGVLG